MLKLNLNTKLFIALSLYLTSLLASNTLGMKIMPFLFGTHLSVAVFFFPFVFLMTDVVGQLYGRATAKNFVWAGFLANAVFFIYAVISSLTAWSPEGAWLQPAYSTIFGVSLRMSIASLVAFIMGEYQDVVIFFLAAKVRWLNHFWLRSTVSNIWSQLIDTLVFMFIAFAGVYSIKTILLMSLPWWIYKVIMGIFYTPLSYLGLRLLKDKASLIQA